MGLNIEYEYVESGKKYNNNDNKFNEKSGETSERKRERETEKIDNKAYFCLLSSNANRMIGVVYVRFSLSFCVFLFLLRMSTLHKNKNVKTHSKYVLGAHLFVASMWWIQKFYM